MFARPRKEGIEKSWHSQGLSLELIVDWFMPMTKERQVKKDLLIEQKEGRLTENCSETFECLMMSRSQKR